MAFDEGLVQRVREVLLDSPRLSEKKMFGGLAFMLDSNMCCGVIGGDLIVRVGPEKYDAALKQDHTRIFDFTDEP